MSKKKPLRGRPLADELRQLLVADTRSLTAIAREVGISQPVLHEFVIGKPDGTKADLRLATAQKLIDFYGLQVMKVKPTK